MSKTTMPTNEEILTFVQEFQEENEAEVFQAIEMSENGDGALNIEIDTDFVSQFEVKYPGVNMDEVLQDFFETLINGFMKEIEEDPNFAENIKEFKNSQEENTEEVPV